MVEMVVQRFIDTLRAGDPNADAYYKCRGEIAEYCADLARQLIETGFDGKLLSYPVTWIDGQLFHRNTYSIRGGRIVRRFDLGDGAWPDKPRVDEAEFGDISQFFQDYAACGSCNYASALYSGMVAMARRMEKLLEQTKKNTPKS